VIKKPDSLSEEEPIWANGRLAAWFRRDAQKKAPPSPAGYEYLHNQIGEPVHHLRPLAEALGRIHHTQNLDDALHPIEAVQMVRPSALAVLASRPILGQFRYGSSVCGAVPIFSASLSNSSANRSNWATTSGLVIPRAKWRACSACLRKESTFGMTLLRGPL
jgi:hypothetical protein